MSNLVYLFIVLIALGGAWIASTVIVGRVAAQPTEKLSFAKSKTRTKIDFFNKTALIGGAATVLAFVLIVGLLQEGILFGVAVYIGTLLLARSANKAKLQDLQDILSFAQTVFPLLTSEMGNSNVATNAAVALPPAKQESLLQAIKDAENSKLSVREAVLLFASREGSKEIDVIMAIVASAFGTSGVGFSRSTGDVAVNIFRRSINQIADVVKQQSGLFTSAKIMLYGIPVIYIFFAHIESGLPGVSAGGSVLGAISTYAGAALVIIDAALSRILLRPKTSIRLIEPDVLERQINAQLSVNGGGF
jgi:hypothetical protein